MLVVLKETFVFSLLFRVNLTQMGKSVGEVRFHTDLTKTLSQST